MDMSFYFRKYLLSECRETKGLFKNYVEDLGHFTNPLTLLVCVVFEQPPIQKLFHFIWKRTPSGFLIIKHIDLTFFFLFSFSELPDTSFTRSISNPEAVMRRRRQQKLEKKLENFRAKDGGQDTGGTLKIYGESIRKDVPYKTLLLSVVDQAIYVVSIFFRLITI